MVFCHQPLPEIRIVNVHYFHNLCYKFSVLLTKLCRSQEIVANQNIELDLGFQRQYSPTSILACSFLYVLHGGLRRDALRALSSNSQSSMPWAQRVADCVHLQLVFRPDWSEPAKVSLQQIQRLNQFGQPGRLMFVSTADCHCCSDSWDSNSFGIDNTFVVWFSVTSHDLND